MTEQIVGTPQTDELVDFLAEIYVDVVKASEGGFNMNDIGYLLPIMQKAPVAIDKIFLVPAELKDLNSAEGAALLALVAAKVGLSQQPAKVKLIVEGVFQLALGGVKIVEGLKA